MPSRSRIEIITGMNVTEINTVLDLRKHDQSTLLLLLAPSTLLAKWLEFSQGFRERQRIPMPVNPKTTVDFLEWMVER